MNYVNLGRSGLKVSRICLGTMNFGPHTSPKDSMKIMDAALDMGINFFDTANVYGWKLGEGVTEKILGDWFAESGKRDSVVLATKVYGEMGKGVNDRRLSAYHIRKACEDSLKRLKTDRIDLYQMHHVDRNTPWDEIWQAMEQLVAAGKVLYVGSSNFAGWDIVHANMTARQRNFMGIVSEQSKYSLMTRQIEREVIPACQEFGVGILPWSPLDSGSLAGPADTGDSVRRKEDYVRGRKEKFADRYEKWHDLCAELQLSPAVAAQAWLLHQPAVTSCISGPRNMKQLEDAVTSSETVLNEDVLKRIDDIFPPAGIAPQYYAW